MRTVPLHSANTMGAPLQSFYPPSVYGLPTSMYPFQQPGAFPGAYPGSGGAGGGGAAGGAGSAGGGNFFGELFSSVVTPSTLVCTIFQRAEAAKAACFVAGRWWCGCCVCRDWRTQRVKNSHATPLAAVGFWHGLDNPIEVRSDEHGITSVSAIFLFRAGADLWGPTEARIPQGVRITLSNN